MGNNMGRPARIPYLQRLAASRRRDERARDAWDALTEKGRSQIRRAVPRLYEVYNLGDLGVAELLVALGEAGILKAWAPLPGDVFETDDELEYRTGEYFNGSETDE